MACWRAWTSRGWRRSCPPSAAWTCTRTRATACGGPWIWSPARPLCGCSTRTRGRWRWTSTTCAPLSRTSLRSAARAWPWWWTRSPPAECWPRSCWAAGWRWRRCGPRRPRRWRASGTAIWTSWRSSTSRPRGSWWRTPRPWRPRCGSWPPAWARRWPPAWWAARAAWSSATRCSCSWGCPPTGWPRARPAGTSGPWPRRSRRRACAASSRWWPPRPRRPRPSCAARA
mmetsp:Transcript_107718/g.246719  ORF Transcript_107718/g.246719 Transcript_107718/m.246719 type:complete len:228 (+) Transcript_107718:1305-1988(+)